MNIESRHVGQWIGLPLEQVYAFASEVTNLPRWAAGLGSAVKNVGGQWFVDTDAGRLGLSFAPPNEYGVLDHHVTMPSGEVVYNPVRVIAAPNGCEIVFTLRRRPEMTDAQLDADETAIRTDLMTLKRLLEESG